MPARKNISRCKQPVKRLLDEVLPKKLSKSKAPVVVIDLVTNNQSIFHEERTRKELNKRKRNQESNSEELLNSSMKSMSQLSIAQHTEEEEQKERFKKVKNSTDETRSSINDNNSYQSSLNEHNHCIVYKPSKYLRMPRKLLLHSLHLQLNHPLKKKKEQNFLLSRVRLFDEQFCLDQIRYLYQVYFDLGSKSYIWPVSFEIILFVCLFMYVINF